MTRLTNAARGKIADMIMSHKFKEQFAALDARQNALGLEGYNHHYTPVQRRLMAELIASAPKRRVLQETTAFKVNVSGWTVKLALAVAAPVFEQDEGGWSDMFSLDAGTALGAKIKQYATDRKELDEQEKLLRRQVTAQLAPHFTYERLIAAWPEIERFANAVERGSEAPVSLPALIDHKALNEALDLPPELAKAA